MLKVIFPATLAACLLCGAAALADEASMPPSVQVIGPAVSRELAVRTSEQISAAAAEAIRPASAKPAGDGGRGDK